MARLGVTYQDVANAANKIVGQERQPTIELIRQLLGTGSTTTIANHLRQWRAEQEGSVGVAMKEQLPPEFISLMKGLWQRLQAHAAEQITSIQQASEQQTIHLSQEIEKYKTNNQRWQKLYDSWAKEKEELCNNNRVLEQTIVSLQTDNAALSTKLAMQDQQFSEKQQRIEELHRLHQLAQENLEHFRESTRVQRLIEQEKQAQYIQQMEISLKAYEQQLLRLNQHSAMLERQLDSATNENAMLQKQKEEIHHQLEQLKSALAKHEKEQGETKRDALHWQKQYKNGQEKLEEQGALLLEWQKEHAVLSQQLSLASDEIKELKDQNRVLTHEKWEIAQEKAQLEGVAKQMQAMFQIKETVDA